MTLRETVEALPAGWTLTMTREQLLEALDASGVPETLTTVQAARFLGRSPKWWRLRCTDGRVEGAWQDEAGKWCFPAASGRAYLGRLQNQHTPAKDRIFRGPNKKAPSPHAARTRTPAREARPVLLG